MGDPSAFSLRDFPVHFGLGATVLREPLFTGGPWYDAYGVHQEHAHGLVTVTLRSGEAAINPPGVWHTADTDGTCTALFITAGGGTENRAR